jgi:predicted  nucleic acid-binding Zn-ribbon protein
MTHASNYGSAYNEIQKAQSKKNTAEKTINEQRNIYEQKAQRVSELEAELTSVKSSYNDFMSKFKGFIDAYNQDLTDYGKYQDIAKNVITAEIEPIYTQYTKIANGATSTGRIWPYDNKSEGFNNNNWYLPFYKKYFDPHFDVTNGYADFYLMRYA